MGGLKAKLPDLFVAEAELSDRATLAQHLPTISRAFGSILAGAPQFMRHSICQRLRVEEPQAAADELHSLLLGQCLRARASLRDADKRNRKRSKIG